MEAQPPPADEFSKKAFFLDYGVIDVSEAHLCQYEGRFVKDPWCGEVFVAQNPWKPNDLVVHIAAIMIGAWVLSPSYVKHKEGAGVQYSVGMCRPRQVWADAGLKRNHAGVWKLILELVSKYKAKWFSCRPPRSGLLPRQQPETNRRSGRWWTIVNAIRRPIFSVLIVSLSC